MRRFFAFGVAWLAAAVVATVVAWQGVGLIGDQVTDKQSSTLSAAQVDAALAGSTTTEATGRSSTSGTPRGSTTTAPGSAGGAGGTPAGTQPSGGGGPGTPGPAATTPAPERVRPIVQTIPTRGGNVTISFSPTGVTFVSATPNPGYALTRNTPGDNNGWRVEFEGTAGRSRVDAWWAGGPQHRVDENPTGGGSGKGSPG